MVHQILWNFNATLRLAFPRCDLAMPWLKLCEIVDNLKPISTWKKVVREKPSHGLVKINTVGSYIQETGKSGIGGIVRDKDGEFIMAFSLPVICNSNNEAETMTAKFLC